MPVGDSVVNKVWKYEMKAFSTASDDEQTTPSTSLILVI
jgi:hypothetical protein